MYMVNQIDLSDVNMRTLLLMILHDLPHDYKVKRLEDLWNKAAPSSTKGAGPKQKGIKPPPNNDTIAVVTDGDNAATAADASAAEAEKIKKADDEEIPDEIKAKLDLDDDDLAGVVAQVLEILKIKYKNDEKKLATLDGEYSDLDNLMGRTGTLTRLAAKRRQILDELKSTMKMHILNALTVADTPGGGSTIMGGRKDQQPIAYDNNRAIFQNPNQEKTNLYIHGLQKKNEESVTSPSNEYLNPLSKQKEEQLQSTSHPQPNKTNPPTVTTNIRTMNKSVTNKSRPIGIRNRRTTNKSVTKKTRRRRRRRRRRTKKKLNKRKPNNIVFKNNIAMNDIATNDIVFKNNIAMNEIFKNAFAIVLNDTKESEIREIQEIVTAFYHFYSMLEITSEISPLDVFNSNYVDSSLSIYLILKRSSINVGLDDLKLIFDTVFSSHNTFKGGGELSDENKNLIKEYTDKYKEYYTGAQKISNENTDIDTLTNDVLELIGVFKDKDEWDKDLIAEYNIKSNTITRQLNTIEIKEKILQKTFDTNSNSRRVKYNENLEDTIKTQYLKIMFENIIIPFEKKEIKEKKITKIQEFSSIDPLDTIATKNPHRLVSALLKGVFKYSGIREVNNQSLDAEQSLDANFYNAEFGRLKLVAKGDGIYLSGDQLDTQLIDGFKQYAYNKKNLANNNTNDWSIQGTLVYNTPPNIINNGVILAPLKLNNIKSKNVTCTLSQRVDAMGNFGDCSTQIDVHESEQKNTTTKLSYTTDIGINAKISGDYYISRMEEIKKRGSREINISYSLKLNDLTTPVFFKTIDNSSHRILDLSLTNTYKSVITRVLYMWANANTLTPEGDTYKEEDIQKLYDILIEKKDTFIDLLLTSLQKGSGDNNQEFNAVFKDRGYVGLPTTPDPFYNKPLLYVANDRPSAVRAMFTLINGSGSINNNVTAGFPPQAIYITRPPPPPPPAVAAKKPVPTAQKPVTTAQKPVTTAQKPVPTAQKPANKPPRKK